MEREIPLNTLERRLSRSYAPGSEAGRAVAAAPPRRRLRLGRPDPIDGASAR